MDVATRSDALPLAGGAQLLAGALLLAAVLFSQRSHAAELNLAAVSCAKYENEVLASTVPGYQVDPIDTVMWLFGFSVAKSGERVMYGDSLRAFGFALDAECKNNPTTSLLDAVSTIKSKRDNPMDLTRLDCATFETRHVALRKSDPESANTLTMWLFGYSVGVSGNHILDAGSLSKFDSALLERCTKHPQDSLFDALSAPNPAVPSSKPAAPKR
jgi:hypothetical protein